MAIDFVAPIIRAALTTLQAQLPAAIAAFNAEDANQVDLTEPVAFEFGAADPLVVFPTIEVSATTGITGPWAIDRSEVDHAPSVNVVVWHEGERGELGPTYELSLGLTRCVIEVLRVVGAFGDGVEISNELGAVTWRTDVIPADPVDPEGRDFLKWRVPVLITFRLETVERF